jgi:AcrR family transcriptional regulator
MSHDNTKNNLIKAATSLFAKMGYSATSVKQIADEAGVNVSLVSYYFGGKEGLYRSCLEAHMGDIGNQFNAFISSFSSFEEFKVKLKLFAETVISKGLEDDEVYCIIRRDVEKDPIDPHVLEVFKKTIVPMFERLTIFISKGQKAGYLRNDISANHLSVLFMGSLQHNIRADRLRKKLYGVSLSEQKERDAFINAAIEMFFYGTENRAQNLSQAKEGTV